VYPLMTLCAWGQQEAVTTYEDVQYSEVARQPRRNSLDLFVPKAKAPPPLIMYVHGGVWTGGSKDRFRVFGRVFAQHGYACALINTQMYPFVKPDTMAEDCGRALGFLHRSADKFGYDRDRLFVMGHSSGAHLVSWLALDDQQLKRAAVPKSALRGAILLSGVYDVRCRHVLLDGVFGSDQSFRTRATPWLYADKTDVPVFLAWGTRDLPGLSLCARILRDRLRGCGVPVAAHQYDGSNHTGYLFAVGTPRDRLMPDVLRFVEDPDHAGPKKVPAVQRSIMWVASCEQERLLGVAVQKAMQPHAVEVIVHELAAATGPAVARGYRDLVARRRAKGELAPNYIGGFGVGALATALAPLSTKADGLAGRILIAAPLGTVAGEEPGLARAPGDLRFLREASLLSVYGDKDPKEHREVATTRVLGLLRMGLDVHPIELPDTSAEQALRAIRWDDDIIAPMLLSYMRP